jgi:hypothetical protein
MFTRIILKKMLLLFVFFVGIKAQVSFAQVVEANSVSQNSSDGVFTKERWGADYLNFMNGPTFSESSGSSINHYLTLKHKFNPDWALSFVFRGDQNFGNAEPSFAVADSFLRLDYPTIYKNDAGLKVKGSLRYIAPMSESSRNSTSAGYVAPFINTSYQIGRFDFSYVLIPKIFLHTKIEDGQKTFGHGHYIATAFKLSPIAKLDFAIYPVWTLNRNDATAFNDLPIYPGMTFEFSNGLSVSPYVEIPLMKSFSENASVGGSLSYTFL